MTTLAAVRHNPYRLFFPCGIVLVWAGLGHWLLHALSILADFRPVFHSVTQIQGFLWSFALGFLFTALPRRLGIRPADDWLLAIGFLAPLVTTVAAWYERWLTSQLAFLLSAAAVAWFLTRDLGRADVRQRLTPGLLWIPVGIASGAIGSALVVAGTELGPRRFWLHELGRLALNQGMFVALIIGVGALVLPTVLYGATATRSDDGRLELIGQIAAAVALVASLGIEIAGSARAGLALRGIVAAWVLVSYAGLRRPPAVPGIHRLLAWVAVWMLPVGYLAAALGAGKGALHVVFIASFALLVLAVSLHVSIAHGPNRERASRMRWPTVTMAAAIAAALAARLLVDLDPARFFIWLGVAASVLLSATVAWVVVYVSANSSALNLSAQSPVSPRRGDRV